MLIGTYFIRIALSFQSKIPLYAELTPIDAVDGYLADMLRSLKCELDNFFDYLDNIWALQIICISDISTTMS